MQKIGKKLLAELMIGLYLKINNQKHKLSMFIWKCIGEKIPFKYNISKDLISKCLRRHSKYENIEKCIYLLLTHKRIYESINKTINPT